MKTRKAVCQFCHESFTSGQLGNHVRWCKKRPRDQAPPKIERPVSDVEFGSNGEPIHFCPHCGQNLKILAEAIALIGKA